MKQRFVYCVLLGCLCLAMLIPPASQAGQVLNDALTTRPFRHHVWQDILTHWVSSGGEVDFARIRAFPRRLNEYLDQLASVSPDSDASYFPTREDQAAYWINAHNAIAMRIILDHYPVTSLSQVNDFETNRRYKLGGKPYTLRQIRARALSYQKYPQILFGLTDYTLDAPPLQPQAYEGKNLKTMTHQALQTTLHNKQLVSFERTGSSCVCLRLSPYFQEYENALFSPPAYRQEDQDAIAAVDRHIKPVSYGNWTDTFRNYAPPSLYSDLGHTCSQRVRFRNANRTLRQAPYQTATSRRIQQ